MEKNATPEFKKSWWQSNRSGWARNSGVGKALAAWEDHCKAAYGKDKYKSQTFKLSVIRKPADFENIYATCEKFRVAIEKARKKTKKTAKDTYACLEKYEEERKRFLAAVQEEYSTRVDRYEKDRMELLKLTEDAIKAMKDHEQGMRKYAEYIAEQEDLALKDLKENSGVLIKGFYDKAQAVPGAAARQKKEIDDRYTKDGKFIKERRGSKYNAESYGVARADSSRLARIFHEATKNMNISTGHYQQCENFFEEINETWESIQSLYFRGKKTNDELAKDAKKLAGTATEMLTSMVKNIGRMSSTLKTLHSAASEAKKTPPTKEYADGLGAYSVKLDGDAARVRQEFDKLQKTCKRGLKRIPDELHRSDPAIKQQVDAIRSTLMKAVQANAKLDSDVKAGRDNYKIIVDSAT